MDPALLEVKTQMGENRRLTICCIGAGYVGGPSMVVFAEHNPDVLTISIDRDQKRVDSWNSNDLPLYEPGLAPLVAKYRGRNLVFTCDAASAISLADIIFIAVNTPTKHYGAFGAEGFDLGYYESAARDIARFSTSPKIVVEKSTVPVRTAEMLRKVLAANAIHPDARFEIISSPEFLAEGTAVKNLEAPDRVLIGCLDTAEGREAAQKIADLYTWVDRSRLLFTNVWSSELIKLAANAMLAQRISSVNSLSALCEKVGADITEVSRVCGADPRIGDKFLNASVGFGGSCFGKDIYGLVYICESLGLPEVAEYWRQVMKINDYSKQRFARRVVTEMFGSVRDKNICVLGFAFKKDTGDTRDTPAADIIKVLVEERANVFVYDPKADPLDITRLFPTGVTVERSAYAAARNAHAIAVVTEWDEFKTLDYQLIYSCMVKPAFIFDGRNVLDHHALGKIGFKVYAIGRSYPQFEV